MGQSEPSVVIQHHDDVGGENTSNEVKLLPSESLAPLLIPPNPSLNEIESTTTTPSIPALLLIPSLRGKLTLQGTTSVCKGVWAMSDSAHDIGQTSDFEFKLVKAQEGSTEFPISGKYHGWFNLKQPKGSIKIDDKEINMQFIQNDSLDGYAIHGAGTNKFGHFTLRGTLSNDGTAQMYREYVLKPLPLPKPKKAPTPLVAGTAASSNSVPTPREGAGRIRKASSILQGFDDPTVKSTTPKSSSTPKAAAVSRTASQVNKDTSAGRAQRLSQGLVKCGELLKEISKHQSAIWFLEPVDYVKLNIPDYPTIISEPMDFRTIKFNLDNGIYKTCDEFADHVRLTFSNAIKYNTARDNPVHIAAKDIQSKFDEKYRILLSNLGLNNDEQPIPLSRQNSAPKRKNSLGRVSSSNQPIAKNPHRFAPPPASDATMASYQEMQRTLLELQNEVVQLRKSVLKQEVVQNIAEKQESSKNPLSLEEKKNLISKMHKLPPEKMEKVVEIIQSALKELRPDSNDGDDSEIEIPLDELDTHTLRRLQQFIADHEDSEKKKKVSTQKPKLKEPPQKKMKKDNYSAVSHVPMQLNNVSSTLHSSNPGDISIFSGTDFGSMRQGGDSEDDESNEHAI